MGFLCPECLRGSLTITERIELEGDRRSDDITLQLVDCPVCGFAGIAVYEESRRGALDAECFDHSGWRIGAEEIRTLRALFEHCPDLQNSDCHCVAHWALNRYDHTGRWDALDSYEKRYFPMRFVAGQ
jgi:hypothetical protein